MLRDLRFLPLTMRLVEVNASIRMTLCAMVILLQHRRDTHLEHISVNQAWFAKDIRYICLLTTCVKSDHFTTPTFLMVPSGVKVKEA